MNNIVFQPIGVIHSPFKSLSDMPNRPDCRASAAGTAEILPHLVPGLKDLEGFSHLVLIFHLHRVQHVELTVTPLDDGVTHGVFATRAPARPNPIGLSVVRLRSIEGCILYLDNLDMLDGTPLLDIKPYVPGDRPPRVRIGWLQAVIGKK